MKKLLIFILVLSLALLSSCDITDADKSYECKWHNDLDFNGLCDACSGNMGDGTDGAGTGSSPSGTDTAGGSCSAHKDNDDNGVCDVCTVSLSALIFMR